MEAVLRNRLLGLAVVIGLFSGVGLAAAMDETPDAVLADGARYYGEMEDGRLHGEGRLEWTNGAVYEGEFRDGLQDGHGEFEAPDGYTYRGEYHQGLAHGDGHLVHPNGDVLRGTFEQGYLVDGVYVGTDGMRYQGAFRYDDFHGEGSLRDEFGNYYIGEFEGGEIVEGEFRGANGEIYRGEFEGWRYHGQGRLERPDGVVHEGAFDNGWANGEGTRTYPDDREAESGEWEYGVFLDRETPRVDPVATSVESLLYSQNALLDASVQSLEPGNPEAVDLYLLSVAGDGGQAVFRREVEYVRDQFAERFGTGNRSMALINSQSTHETRPLATVTSIRESLAAMGEIMDVEEDVLFLFLTSHGTRDHRFVLNQNGLDLPDLTPAVLSQALDESGIRWRVLIVSACYSGGFIDALEGERTLVITAARHDRVSFGCSDEAAFTEFGRAYFEQALAETDSFREAFRRTRGLVREREQALGVAEHSDPQMSVGAEIADHLDAWLESRPAAEL